MLAQQVAETVEQLPVYKAVEVLDFARYLLAKASDSALTQNQTDALDPAKNPLLEYAGGISFGNLSDNIDDIVYGQ